MTGFFAGDAQAAIRAVTSTTRDYNGDWAALFDGASVPSGDWNGRFIQWVNGRFSTSFTNFPEAWNYTVSYAQTNGWPATVAAASLDWASYDGTNNGTLQTDMLSGTEQRAGWAASIDSTSILLAQTEGGNDAAKLVTRIVTRSDTTPTLGAVVTELITGITTGITKIVRMTSTRYLIASRTFKTTGSIFNLFLYLVDKTGALVDSETTTFSDVGSNIVMQGLTRHSDVRAVLAHADPADKHPQLRVINITGDTISIGSPTEVTAAISTAQNYPAALTATSGHLMYNTELYRYTISGDAITVGNKAATAQPSSELVGVERIDDTHSLIAYRVGGANVRGIEVAVVTDATTPTVGTGVAATDATYNMLPSLFGSMLTRSHTTEYEYIVNYQENSTGDIVTNVVTVDPASSYAITKVSSSDPALSSGHDAEHGVVCPFEDSGYAFVFWQDNLNSNAMGGIVMAGN